MANYYYAAVRTVLTLNEEHATYPYTVTNKQKTITGFNGSRITYVIDVYVSPESNFAKWCSLSNKGDLLGQDYVKATINLNGTSKNIDVSEVFNDGYSHWIGNIIRHKGQAGGTESFTPTVTIQQKYGTGSFVNVTNILWLNNSKGPQTISWTAKKAVPTFPDGNVTGWAKGRWPGLHFTSTIKIADKYWDQCQNRWYVMFYLPHSGVNFLAYFDNDGNNAVEPLKEPGDISTASTADRKAWNDKNWAIFNAAKKNTNCGGDSGSTNGDTMGGDYTGVPPVPPTDSSRWNPPPHVGSRSIPYGVRTNLLDKNGNAINDNLVSLINAGNYSTTSLKGQNSYQQIERGRIFQDKVTASIMNNTAVSLPKGSTSALQWGFRFMYNPTTISYSTSANNSIDWTLGTKDSAALLAGNQTVSFQLYINRIVDMSYLQDYTSGSMTQAYGRELSPDERQGILKRGTEYDIEFLYRALTGDPITNNPLLSPGWGASADIGYITGVPLWLYLNDNLRYYGAITGITVNHVIFDLNMIPMLSVMDVQFSRYPAQFGNDASTVKSIVKTINSATAGASTTGAAGTGAGA